jgi:hypothetical protein
MAFERYLGVKNKLTVYQHYITSEGYNFFRILEQQKEITGTVFNPHPAEVKGNMLNVEDEREQVIGFFDVSGFSVKEVTIMRKDIDYPGCGIQCMMALDKRNRRTLTRNKSLFVML